MTGDAGEDRLIGGPGRNQYLGGDGDDEIDAANGVRETRINCVSRTTPVRDCFRLVAVPASE